MRSIYSGILLLLLACGGESSKSISPPGRVFLISIDTLRSDRLPAYGYKHGATPAIDALRRDAILFERAYSPCPLTLPAHASIFTGLLPPSHGVRDNSGYRLRQDQDTIASRLKELGYQTGAAISSYILRRGSGVERGFDFYDDAMDVGSSAGGSAVERDGSRTAELLEKWISAQPAEKSVFAFLHLYEPHSPYDPPPRFQGGDPYNGEVSYSDSILGSFIEFLKERQMYDPALIILLSDHGEGLGDHGEDEHGIFLYRETIQVPLLVKLPHQHRAGESITTPVSLTDISPMILRIAAGDGDRQNLLTSNEHRAIYAETYFPRLHLGWSESFSLIDQIYHYIEAPRRELYDMKLDPAEQKNVLDDERRVAFAMKAALDRVDRNFDQPATVGAEETAKLAALGYVGSATTEGALPDAKDHIGSLHVLKAAYAAQRAGNDRMALDRLDELIKLEPQMIDGWTLKAETLRKSGRKKEALATLREAVRRFPSRADLLIMTSDALLEAGNTEAARTHASAALAGDEAGSREALARIALQSGDAGGAERELSALLSREPGRVSAMLLLSQALVRQRKYADALAMLDRAEAQLKSTGAAVPELQRKRGEALLELGRVAEAEAAFRSEVSRFPGDLEAWGALAVTLAAQHRDAEAQSVLAELVRRNPTQAARKLAAETAQVIAAAQQR